MSIQFNHPRHQDASSVVHRGAAHTRTGRRTAQVGLFLSAGMFVI